MMPDGYRRRCPARIAISRAVAFSRETETPVSLAGNTNLAGIS
jgi:hypothetical protein